MLCPMCGNYLKAEEVVCPVCGAMIPPDRLRKPEGAEAIRQGKRAREAARRRPEPRAASSEKRRRGGASHAAVPGSRPEEARQGKSGGADSRIYADDIPEGAEPPTEPVPGPIERKYRPVYDDTGIRAEQAQAFAASYEKKARGRARRVNWMKVGFILVIAVIVLLGAGWVFLKRTDPGQRILARLGQEANSTALWGVGEEMLDQGDINGAIASFEKAWAQDREEGAVDVDGLLLLGNAYEAAGMIDEAEKLYEQIYTETPSRTEAYVNHIRILLARGGDGDRARAGELMKLAYDKTGDDTFRTQRSDLLPAPPEVDLTAGYYESKKYIAITSYQGFDVYYTFDDQAELPFGGTKYTERVFLDEGIHNLRAVAVNGELVSDELHGTYKIIMPSPQTPRATLAPATYKTRQRVRLKPGLDNVNDDDIVIYYTVDGSPPDADSPIYHEGESIALPTGRIVLKAVAVNKYNKVSNTLEINYKIEAKPWPLSGCTTDDTINGLKLYQTTMTEFQLAFGEGTPSEEEISLEGFETECRKYEYPWGYAVMNRTKTGWVLAELYITSTGTFTPPRGTNLGDTESFVTGKFRDMGQVESESGNRGLYANSDGTGKIWLQEDGTKIIRYRADAPDSAFWQLDYHVNKNGTVDAIDWLYCP